MKNAQLKIKKRNAYIDLVKAFAIFLVVLGHCIQYGSGSSFLNEKLFFENNLFKFLYSFHMPLFMLISGYLFANGINKKAKDIIINKFKSLIIPIIMWALLPLAIFIITSILEHEFSFVFTIKRYIIYCISSLWFLWAVFFCSLVVVAVNKLFKDNILVHVLIFIVSFIVPDVLNLALYKYMYPFFVIGYYYNKGNFEVKLNKVYNNYYFILAVAIIFFLSLQFFETEIYIYKSKHTIINKNIAEQIYINLFRYAIGLIGSIFALTTLLKLYQIKTLKKIATHNKLILFTGKSTMGIYIISCYINEYFLIPITKSLSGTNYLIILIETITVILLSLLIIKLIQKCNFLNKYLLGAKV